MLGKDYHGQVCSVARALEVIGERWTLLILRDLSFGIHRFDELVASLGVTRSVLATRLAGMEAAGILERRPYQERPTRFEYHATAKGYELYPVIALLMQWGDRHYPHPEGPPRLLRHRDCGGAIDDHLSCDRCGQRLYPEDVLVLPGPALPRID